MAVTHGSSRSTAEPRDELLNINEFGSLTEAQVVIEDWRKQIQHLAAPLGPRRAHPHRVRCPMHPPKPADTPITAGPTNGAPSQPPRFSTTSRSKSPSDQNPGGPPPSGLTEARRHVVFA